MNFKKLIGKRVSLMIDRENGKIENDIGIVESWDDPFLTIKPNNPAFSVETIVIRKDIIRSVWVFKE